MLQTKLFLNRFIDSDEDLKRDFIVIGHGGNPGHVTVTIFINFHFLLQIG